MQSHADVDFEFWVPHICLVSLGALLKGILVVLKVLFKMIDVFLEHSLLPVMSVFPSLDCDA